ncbi:MAG: THxN family PEP-CTERM protein, partial [Desulfobacterales bacterium]
MKKHWKNSVIGLLVIGFLLFCGGLAGAATVTVGSVNGAWENEVLTGDDVDYEINNSSEGGTSTIYWGDPASEAGQSGYEFASVGTPFDVETNGTLFELGDFTHENRPIYAAGGSLDSVDLLVDLGISGLDPFDVTFAFDHDETTNTDDPEASRDIVTILNLPNNQIFNLDDDS